MKRQAFSERYKPDWTKFEQMLLVLEGGSARVDLRTFPELYRRICRHLALARHRGYGADYVDYLNDLAIRGHRQLYGRRPSIRSNITRFISVDFPRVVRANGRFVLLAAVLLFAPDWIMQGAVRLRPALVYSVMSPEQVVDFEAMYDPEARRMGGERGSMSDIYMFGFYIRNNITVGFRTFAGGMLFGLGTAFFLIYNGLLFGGVAGHLHNIGYAEPFRGFVAGHGPFELTAIVLAGAAGFKIGMALLAPGRRSRARALLEEAKSSAPLIYGFAGLLVLAAFVEAFWSSTNWIPFELKIAVGWTLWTAVFVYFGFGGRE